MSLLCYNVCCNIVAIRFSGWWLYYGIMSGYIMATRFSSRRRYLPIVLINTSLIICIRRNLIIRPMNNMARVLLKTEDVYHLWTPDTPPDSWSGSCCSIYSLCCVCFAWLRSVSYSRCCLCIWDSHSRSRLMFYLRLISHASQRYLSWVILVIESLADTVHFCKDLPLLKHRLLSIWPALAM